MTIHKQFLRDTLLTVGLSLSVVGAWIPATAKVAPAEKPTFEIYGFINNQAYCDSRKFMQGANGLSNVIPLDSSYGKNGTDLNGTTAAHMLAITTRLGGRVQGPEVLNAKTSGQIEADFTGFGGSPTMLSLRHAFIRLNWHERNVLTVGQTWHPVSGDVLPTTLGIGTGAPFNPFNRSPQIRFDKYLLKSGGLKLSAALLYESQYASEGPEGRSSDYKKYALTPECYVGANLTLFPSFTIGAGGGWNSIMPYQKTATGALTTKRVNSFYGMVQAAYTGKRLSLKGKYVWGGNMSHLGIMSGYFATGIDSNGEYSWATLPAISGWLHASYNIGQVQFGLFAGYTKSMGSKEKVLNLESMYVYGSSMAKDGFRMAPNCTYTLGPVVIGFEYELTGVTYRGVEGSQHVTGDHLVLGHRLLGSLTYNF